MARDPGGLGSGISSSEASAYPASKKREHPFSFCSMFPLENHSPGWALTHARFSSSSYERERYIAL